MVRFAGYDETEEALEVLSPFAAHRLFKSGMDTLTIAEWHTLKEAHVQELVSRGRSLARGLPSPYPSRER